MSMRIGSEGAQVPRTDLATGPAAPREAPEAVPGAADVFEAQQAGRSLLDVPSGRGVGSDPPTFTGFDAGKLAAPLKLGADGQPKSAKYTFAKLAQESGEMPRTKAESESWFNQHIRPGMEAAGFGVDWVKGDKAFIRTRENPEGSVVDFVRGAGSGDRNYQALAWQVEEPGGGGGGGGGGTVGIGDMAHLLLTPWQPPAHSTVQEDEARLLRESVERRQALLASKS